MFIDLLATTGAAFDAEAATRAYLDTLQGPARAQSDAYFEGGYWLILFGAAVAVLIDWLFLRLRFTHGLRSLAERVSKRAWLVTWMTALGYLLASAVVTMPWSIYTGFVRERQYDLLDQPFAGWFAEQMTALAISLVIAPLLIAVFYALIRRAPRSWWVWGTGVTGLFLLLAMVLGPVFLAPLFNEYTEMEQGPLRDRIEAVAARYDIPAEHIYVFDQSKQHKRISANVSGLGPTIRISLNDNLLERTSEAEILAVMGHEMGHYKLNHVWWMLGIMLAILALGLFITSRAAPWLIRKYGDRWGVRDVADPASMPVLGICLALWMFAMTPAINSLIRINESHADAFGLDAAEEPDGFARVSMRLSEYRKIEPGPLEEILFFDHPSGATRVRMAMEWKAANVDNPQIVVPEEGYLDSQ
ncbi:M48 family metallopeptidase [Qipengyuania zhejiangensis]|uniref:M48 family metallopeptidase n=1 Tax=Qipengyuania zhejiangensis TaxID=3077782 RepID=UPI002D76AE80|nr:M48 family metallopeptidase [Qipengyuania sp. Z2]